MNNENGWLHSIEEKEPPLRKYRVSVRLEVWMDFEVKAVDEEGAGQEAVTILRDGAYKKKWHQHLTNLAAKADDGDCDFYDHKIEDVWEVTQ